MNLSMVSEMELAKIAKNKLYPTNNELVNKAEDIALVPEAENVDQTQQDAISSDQKRRTELSVPYRTILRDYVVWVVLMTYWSDEIGFEMLGQFGPIYLNRVCLIDRYTAVIR